MVNTFGLTVRLRMVGGGQGLINPQRGTKRSGEFGGELSPTVGDEFTWETKAFPHMIAIEKGRLFGSDVRSAGDDNSRLSDVMVHKNGDGVEAMGFG